ncbi:MAG: hypothetical protein AB1941_25525 [Gemmatimonadota bacterium]
MPRRLSPRLTRAALAALALLAACGTPDPDAGGGRAPRAVPADFAVRYEWGNGVLPPPHHYDYTVRLGPGAGTGRVEFRPGYDSLPVWTETFPVSEAQLRSVFAVFMARGVFDRAWGEGRPLAGGETEWLEATADGRSVTLPSQPRDEDRVALREVYAAVRAAVPRGVLAGLVARQERFQQEGGASGGAPLPDSASTSPDGTP